MNVSQTMEWLSDHQASMVEDLIGLANINSGSSNLPGLENVARKIEDWMGLSAACFQRIELPPRKIVTDEGQLVSASAGPLLRWDYEPSAARRVLLAIHYDTVFAADHQFQRCEQLPDGRLQGPGVADAKGGIVVIRYALHALASIAAASGLGWTVLLNPDEEIGSPSSTAYFQSVAEEFDFGLLFEPCLPTGELVSTRKGSGNYDLVVRGRAAHAGRHFEDGRNAVAMLCDLMKQIDALNGQRDGATINIGFVKGGGAVNVVPDLAVGRLNVRLADQESIVWFDDALNRIVSSANRQDGFQVELYGGITSPPKQQTEPLQALMTAIEDAHTQCGVPATRWKHTGGVCDGNKLAAAGLTNVDTMGPVGDGLHSDKEWVLPSSLVTKSQIVVRLLAQFANGSFSLD